MSDTKVIIEGMAFTVLLLAASYMVILHIKMYIDWKNCKRWTKEQEEFVKRLRQNIEEEAKKRATRDS